MLKEEAKQTTLFKELDNTINAEDQNLDQAIACEVTYRSHTHDGHTGRNEQYVATKTVIMTRRSKKLFELINRDMIGSDNEGVIGISEVDTKVEDLSQSQRDELKLVDEKVQTILASKDKSLTRNGSVAIGVDEGKHTAYVDKPYEVTTTQRNFRLATLGIMKYDKRTDMYDFNFAPFKNERTCISFKSIKEFLKGRDKQR